MDVETILYSFKDGRLGCVVITSVHGTDGVRPAFLRGLDSCPQDPFPSTPSIAEWVEESNYSLPVFWCLPTVCS